MNQSDTPRRRSLDHVALAVVAVIMLPAGLQAAFTPTSFFDDFPIGRAWISPAGEAYNEHLVRDVGALFLAMVIITAWTVLRHGPTRPVAVAWLVFGLLHLAFHTRHLDGFGRLDQVGLVASVVIVPVLAAIAIWAVRDQR